MKILCLIDIDNFRNRNSFPIDFVRSLKKNEYSTTIDYGIKWLNNKYPVWDIVHIHWPEDLLKGKVITNKTIRDLDQKLKSWGRLTKIICTVHNHTSHNNTSQLSNLLYKVVFNNCFGFIHLGNKSIGLFNTFYSGKYASVSHVVIPHGNYSSMGSITNKNVARKKLGLEDSDKIILVVGKIRNLKEFDLMLNSFNAAATPNCKLLFCGTFQSAKSFLKAVDLYAFFKQGFITINWRYKLYRTKNVITRIGIKSDDLLSKYLSASDILFIPRQKVINSGNVPLGFTFAKVVVGPNYGDVGELLEQHGNPTFETTNSFIEINKKLVEGLILSSTDLPLKNMTIANTLWDWENIAQQHINFYNFLIKNYH